MTAVTPTPPSAPDRPRAGLPVWLKYVLIGLLAGLLSGLFGVGGGTVIVPLLVLLCGFDQRLASGTSLAAILPTAVVGVISYAAVGSVSWLAALLLAVGAVAGAQIGTWLLPRLPVRALQWGFVGFLAIVIVNLFLVIPSRDVDLVIGWGTGAALLGVGLVTGTLAGLLGVGGGVVVVPALILLFDASDLVAKGTSLLMMIPTALSGTLGNVKRGNTDLRAAAWIAAGSCVSTAGGAQLARILDPAVATPLFAVFLIVVQLGLKARRTPR
jgi:uncharacterized membrane protein YfcA